jgi:hypothetical protein
VQESGILDVPRCEEKHVRRRVHILCHQRGTPASAIIRTEAGLAGGRG